MFTRDTSVTAHKTSILSTHTVLRNTYLLLSMTLLFSSVMTWVSMLPGAPQVGILGIVGMFGLLFLTQALSRSPWGLLSVFAFTGFMGYTLGPILNLYLAQYTNGGELIMTALGATGIIFFALSAYVLTTGKDFTYMGGFLFVGLIAVMIASVLSFWFPVMQLFISMATALIFAGFILFETSQIINGGQTNYILATISLYLSILNLFLSLLRILAAFSGNRN